MDRYTRRRHISSFVITSPNPRIGNENGVVIIEDERLQKNEAFKFIYYIVMFLLDPFTISSTIPCLKYIYSNYMFSMFSLCVYMLYAAYEGSILWIEKICMLKSIPIVGLISICNIFVLCSCPYSYTWCKYLLLLFPYFIFRCDHIPRCKTIVYLYVIRTLSYT